MYVFVCCFQVVEFVIFLLLIRLFLFIANCNYVDIVLFISVMWCIIFSYITFLVVSVRLFLVFLWIGFRDNFSVLIKNQLELVRL